MSHRPPPSPFDNANKEDYEIPHHAAPPASVTSSHFGWDAALSTLCADALTAPENSLRQDMPYVDDSSS
jgi:hypothetical protein